MTCRRRDQDAPPPPPSPLRHQPACIKPTSDSNTFECINSDRPISAPELERSDPFLHSPSLCDVRLREPLSHSATARLVSFLLPSHSRCYSMRCLQLHPELPLFSFLRLSLSCLLLALRHLRELLQPHCADVLASTNVLISQRPLLFSFSSLLLRPLFSSFAFGLRRISLERVRSASPFVSVASYSAALLLASTDASLSAVRLSQHRLSLLPLPPSTRRSY